jgi:hypothetical protein
MAPSTSKKAKPGKKTTTKISAAKRKATTPSAHGSTAFHSSNPSAAPTIATGQNTRATSVEEEEDDTPDHVGDVLDAADDAIMREVDKDGSVIEVDDDDDVAAEDADAELSKLI